MPLYLGKKPGGEAAQLPLHPGWQGTGNPTASTGGHPHGPHEGGQKRMPQYIPIISIFFCPIEFSG
jgi:hypothetical protein